MPLAENVKDSLSFILYSVDLIAHTRIFLLRNLNHRVIHIPILEKRFGSLYFSNFRQWWSLILGCFQVLEFSNNDFRVLECFSVLEFSNNAFSVFKNVSVF